MSKLWCENQERKLFPSSLRSRVIGMFCLQLIKVRNVSGWMGKTCSCEFSHRSKSQLSLVASSLTCVSLRLPCTMSRSSYVSQTLPFAHRAGLQSSRPSGLSSLATRTSLHIWGQRLPSWATELRPHGPFGVDLSALPTCHRCASRWNDC